MTVRDLVHKIYEAHRSDPQARHRLAMMLLWITGVPRARN